MYYRVKFQAGREFHVVATVQYVVTKHSCGVVQSSYSVPY